MDDFKKQGGSLTGREERTDHFNDEPRLVAGGRGSQTKPDRGGMVGMDGNSTGVKGEMPADADRGYDKYVLFPHLVILYIKANFYSTSSRGYDKYVLLPRLVTLYLKANLLKHQLQYFYWHEAKPYGQT